MVFVNDQEISLLKENHPSRLFYEEQIRIIQLKNDYVTIRKYESESKFLYNDAGVPLTKSLQTVPYQAILRTTRGMETWRYAENRDKQKNERWKYTPSHLFVSDEVTLNPQEEADKIFILVTCGAAEKSGCYEYDPIKDAESKAEKMGGDELDVRFLIYKDSDLSYDDLVLIAQAWGLNDAGTTNITVLRNKLYDTVAASEKNIAQTTRGFRQFITDVKNIRTPKFRDRVEDRAVINKAVTDGVVVFDPSTFRWLYKEGGEAICQVPRDQFERKVDILLDRLRKRPDEFDSIRNEVWEDKEPPVYSIADIDQMNTDKELRTAAKHMGVKYPINIKPENGKKILVSHLSDENVSSEN